MSSASGPLLLLVSTLSYHGRAFREAAARAGVALVVGTDRCHVLAEQGWDLDGMLTLDFRDAGHAVEQIALAAERRPFVSIVATSERTAEIAALASRRLGLRHNPPRAAEAAANKATLRARLSVAGVPTPRARTFDLDGDPARFAERVRFPCVLKPLLLSGSRGVIRADDRASFVVAFERIARLLRTPELLAKDPIASHRILVEDFVPGVEVALEGLAEHGVLRALALFDKPDPLDGPFFEETLYVTPSRLPPPVQDAIVATAADAARAIGGVEGPVHAELRVGADGVPVVIEIAARSIGGLCGRTLRFGAGMSLEELVVRHAAGLPIPSLAPQGPAAGVMMLPIPRGGVLESVSGLEAARATPLVEDVVIDTVGRRLVPLPEGDFYLGFIFARGDDPASVEAALRAAHAEIDLRILPELVGG
ncbi:MAG: ATP-grasp domain-containing protein [Polyangiales bacterium]